MNDEPLYTGNLLLVRFTNKTIRIPFTSGSEMGDMLELMIGLKPKKPLTLEAYNGPYQIRGRWTWKNDGTEWIKEF